MVSFVTCLAGSAILFGTSEWVWHSVSYLGTGTESLYFFSISLVITAVFGLIFIVLSITEAGWYPGQTLLGKIMTVISVTLFLISYLSLILVAIVSVSGDKLVHFLFAFMFFIFYI